MTQIPVKWCYLFIISNSDPIRSHRVIIWKWLNLIKIVIYCIPLTEQITLWRSPLNLGKPSRGTMSLWPVGRLATSTQTCSGWTQRITQSLLTWPPLSLATTPFPSLSICVMCPKTAQQGSSAKHTSSTRGLNSRRLYWGWMVSYKWIGED